MPHASARFRRIDSGAFQWMQQSAKILTRIRKVCEKLLL